MASRGIYCHDRNGWHATGFRRRGDGNAEWGGKRGSARKERAGESYRPSHRPTGQRRSSVRRDECRSDFGRETGEHGGQDAGGGLCGHQRDDPPLRRRATFRKCFAQCRAWMSLGSTPVPGQSRSAGSTPASPTSCWCRLTAWQSIRPTERRRVLGTGVRDARRRGTDRGDSRARRHRLGRQRRQRHHQHHHEIVEGHQGDIRRRRAAGTPWTPPVRRLPGRQPGGRFSLADVRHDDAGRPGLCSSRPTLRQTIRA